MKLHIWHKHKMRRARKFARRAKAGEVKVLNININAEHGGQSKWVWEVTPNTKKNRRLLDDAVLYGYISPGLFGRVRYLA